MSVAGTPSARALGMEDIVMNPDDNGHSSDKMLGGITGKGFRPGQSGNPKGRPRGSGITDRLRAIVEADDGKIREILVKRAVMAAAEGDFRFFKEILDRLDGTVEQNIQLQETAPSIKIAMYPGKPPDDWYKNVRQWVGYKPGDPLLPGETEEDIERLRSEQRP